MVLKQVGVGGPFDGKHVVAYFEKRYAPKDSSLLLEMCRRVWGDRGSYLRTTRVSSTHDTTWPLNHTRKKDHKS